MNLLIRLFICFTLVCYATPASGKHLKYEAEYQIKWCSEHSGVIPSKSLPSGLRPDCVIPGKAAIEFDFAYKYREGIIQAIEYADETGLKAIVILIMENPGQDIVFIKRALKVVELLKKNNIQIDIFVI